MEEVQLGTDSFYYVWEDTGNLFTSLRSVLISLSLFFHLFSLPVWHLRFGVLAAALQGEVMYHLKERDPSSLKGKKTTKKPNQLCGQTSEICAEITKNKARDSWRKRGSVGHWAVDSGDMFSNSWTISWKCIQTFWSKLNLVIFPVHLLIISFVELGYSYGFSILLFLPRFSADLCLSFSNCTCRQRLWNPYPVIIQMFHCAAD